MLNCPRDATDLQTTQEHGIQVDRCATCKGEWFDFGELAELEASIAKTDADKAGMIEYSKRPGELACPVCAKTMTAFDYRGHGLELDACSEEHGFWLDAGESEGVRAVMRERVSGVQRSQRAEARWNREREANFKSSLIDRIRNLFTGGRL